MAPCSYPTPVLYLLVGGSGCNSPSGAMGLVSGALLSCLQPELQAPSAFPQQSAEATPSPEKVAGYIRPCAPLAKIPHVSDIMFVFLSDLLHLV